MTDRDDYDHRHHYPSPYPLFDRDPKKVIVVEPPPIDICYTPADHTKWAGTPPKTVQEAIDRIAAVLGATTPIP
jgi:hypothetical protein